MWRRIAFSLFLSVASWPNESSAAEEIEIVPRLRAGDEFSLQLVHTRENSSRPQHNGKGTTIIAVRVIEVAPDGVILEWTPGEATIDNPQVAQEPMFKAATEATRGMSLRLKLNADGDFAGLLNQDDVGPRLKAAVDGMMGELKKNLPDEQRASFDSMIGAVLSPEMLLSSATRDVQTYFGLYGASLEVGEPVEIELEQPNPLGGRPLPAVLRVHAKSATKSSAVIQTTTKYASEALTQMTEALLKKSGQPISSGELAKAPPLTMEDEGKYVFDRTHGLMREIVIKRRLKAGDVQRFDGWQITLVKAPKR